MSEHPIQGLMKTSMENLKKMVDVDTIVGEAVKTEYGETIIPISKVTFGFAAGGSEFKASKPDSTDTLPFGGGSGGGVSITPIAFLVVNQDGVELKHIEERVHILEKILDQMPKMLDKVAGEAKKETIQPTDANWE